MPVDVHWETPGTPEGSHARADGCPKEALSPWDAHSRVGFWQDAWSHGERVSHWSMFAMGLVIQQGASVGAACA